jgi:hypothetical protein
MDDICFSVTVMDRIALSQGAGSAWSYVQESIAGFVFGHCDAAAESHIVSAVSVLHANKKGGLSAALRHS